MVVLYISVIHVYTIECTVGTKLPIMFIVRDEVGGEIEDTELGAYPPGHLYCVQKKAWMDRRG